MKTRKKLSVLLVAGGLAFGMAACEAEEGGTSPGIEDGTGGGDVGGDPMAPADDGGLEDDGLGEG